MADFSKVGKKSCRKGKTHERRVARKLSELLNMEFKRTPQSGGGHVPGDVMRLDGPFRLEIECKDRVQITIEKVFKNPTVLRAILADRRLVIFNSDGKDYCVLHEKWCKRTMDVLDRPHGFLRDNEGDLYALFPIDNIATMLWPSIYKEGKDA